MNDATLSELKIVVEQAVRPLRASNPRKRRMREELLSHLMTIYEDELGRLGDEQAALEQAGQRLGDPRELTGQFQKTEPAWSRFAFLLEKLRLERGESLLHFAGKIVLLTFLLHATVILVLLPLLSITGRVSEIAMALHVFLVIGIASAAFVFVLGILADRIPRVAYGRASERSMRKTGLYSLASLPVLPLFTFVIYWSLPLDGSARLFHLQLSCFLSPTMPVLFLLLARQHAEGFRYEDEWASLEIGE
jgi:hypothetical protein